MNEPQVTHFADEHTLKRIAELEQQIIDTKQKLMKYIRAFKSACDGGGDWCKGCELSEEANCSACREKYYLENAKPPLVVITDPVKMWQPDNQHVYHKDTVMSEVKGVDK